MDKRLSEFFTKEIAKKAGFIYVNAALNPTVTGLEFDSRKIKKGNLFFALPGLHTDGNLYINDAIKNGASVIVYQDDVAEINPEIVYLKVKNARYAMSSISASFYDFPSRSMFVTGVTGTEGKSTTVYLIWQLLKRLGKKCGFISTVQYCMGDEVIWNPEHQTTPEAPVVHRLLREMANNGCEFAIVEASSHGLSPKTNRLGDVEFSSGVFTNITHEHLEFHGTFEQYRDDKMNLFRALDRWIPSQSILSINSNYFGPFGVVNADDKNSRHFIKATKHKTFTYSPQGRDGDVILEIIESSPWDNWYSVFIPALKEHIDIRDKLPGSFNSGNVLAALLTVSGSLKLPLREIAPLVKFLKPVRGRMTLIDKGQPFEVVVDYAHTPSSFQTVFHPIRARINQKRKRMIVLFGSAGERDTEKRAQQGKIAALYCDIIILTDEDPRGEDSIKILEDIALGVLEERERIEFKRDENLHLIPDRKSAIRKAISLAKEGDVVLLLGKGHENSIIYADKAIPYDEISETEKALIEAGYK